MKKRLIALGLFLALGAVAGFGQAPAATDCVAGSMPGPDGYKQISTGCDNTQGPVASGVPIVITNNPKGKSGSFEYIITGTPATASIVLKGCMNGASTCDAALDTYIGTVNAIREPSISVPYDYFTITPTFTGGSAPKLKVKTTLTTANGGGTGSGGPPSGPCGGDLAGSYPNCSVGGLLGNSLGSIAVGYPHWNGTVFVWDTPAGSMTWPAGAAGVPNYNGSSAWGASYNAGNPFPVNFIPILNQNTTGTAGGLSANIAESQVTSLSSDLSAKEVTANKDAASGYAGLDAGTKLKTAEIPASVVQTGQANTYGAFLQDFTSASMKIPASGGCVATASVQFCIDSTAHQVHVWTGAGDLIIGSGGALSGMTPGDLQYAVNSSTLGSAPASRNSDGTMALKKAVYWAASSGACPVITEASNTFTIDPTVSNCAYVLLNANVTTPPTVTAPDGPFTFTLHVIQAHSASYDITAWGSSFTGNPHINPTADSDNLIEIRSYGTGSQYFARASCPVCTFGIGVEGSELTFTPGSGLGYPYFSLALHSWAYVDVNGKIHAMHSLGRMELLCSDTSGSNSAQTCSTAVSFTPAANDSILYTTTTANAGDLTVNVNGLGPKHVRKWLGQAVLASGDLPASMPVKLHYDGTYWEIETIGNAPTGTGTTVTIANGTSALGTSAIASGACASVVTTSATGTATTDNIMADFNADPTSTTGYIPSSSGMLTIIKYPTSNNVNFKVCNNTGSSITPGAVTLNWRVVR